MVTKITGDNLDIYLRKMTLEDTDAIIKWRNSDSVRPYFIYQEPFTKEGHLHWIKTMIEPGHGYQFMICDIKTHESIGSAYLRYLDPIHNKIEYGLFIGENRLRGKGIGSQATLLTLQFAFQHLNVNKVHSKVLKINQMSNGMCNHLGWQTEGILREDVKLQGIMHDVILYGVLNSEYKKVNGYKEYIE